MTPPTPTTPDKSAPEKGWNEKADLAHAQWPSAHDTDATIAAWVKKHWNTIERGLEVLSTPAQETGQQDAEPYAWLLMSGSMYGPSQWTTDKDEADLWKHQGATVKPVYAGPHLSAEKNYVGEDRVKADDFWPIDSTEKANEPITRPRGDWWWLCKKIEFQRRELKQLNEWLAVYRAREPAPSSPREGVEFTDDDLHRFGYAKGNYSAKCMDCRLIDNWLDKRATRCRKCAEKAARQSAPPASGAATAGALALAIAGEWEMLGEQFPKTVIAALSGEAR